LAPARGTPLRWEVILILHLSLLPLLPVAPGLERAQGLALGSGGEAEGTIPVLLVQQPWGLRNLLEEGLDPAEPEEGRPGGEGSEALSIQDLVEMEKRSWTSGFTGGLGRAVMHRL
jgi:hypothetical protein